MLSLEVEKNGVRKGFELGFCNLYYRCARVEIQERISSTWGHLWWSCCDEVKFVLNFTSKGIGVCNSIEWEVFMKAKLQQFASHRKRDSLDLGFAMCYTALYSASQNTDHDLPALSSVPVSLRPYDSTRSLAYNS